MLVIQNNRQKPSKFKVNRVCKYLNTKDVFDLILDITNRIQLELQQREPLTADDLDWDNIELFHSRITSVIPSFVDEEVRINCREDTRWLAYAF